MNNNYSLMELLNNPSIIDNERFEKKIKEVKKNKQNLLSAAEEYNNQHKEEIREGTRQKALLLAEGESRGLSEEEIFKDKGFIPSVYTPILNFLYFMLKDCNDIENELKLLRENAELEHENIEIDAPEMEEFIYGNMTHDTFKKIKKLKALSRSKNEKEAFLAYRKCLELCDKYSLEFDKIPCNLD